MTDEEKIKLCDELRMVDMNHAYRTQRDMISRQAYQIIDLKVQIVILWMGLFSLLIMSIAWVIL